MVAQQFLNNKVTLLQQPKVNFETSLIEGCSNASSAEHNYFYLGTKMEPLPQHKHLIVDSGSNRSDQNNISIELE